MSTTPMYVRMQLTNFQWQLSTGIGVNGGQPYLWTVFFKVDGTTVSLGPNLYLQGKATVVGMPGNQGDLGSHDFGPASSATLLIPVNIATYGTVLQPIPALGSVIPGVIGCVAIVLIQRSTPANAVSQGHDALNTAIQQQLDTLIPTFGISNQPTPANLLADIQNLKKNVISAVEGAISNALTVWQKLAGDQDVECMTAIFLGVQESATALPQSVINLADVPPQGTPLQQTTEFAWVNGRGDPTGYSTSCQLNGLVVADPFPLSLKRLFTGLGYPLPLLVGRLIHGSVQAWLASGGP
jgi:hypothetical protein